MEVEGKTVASVQDASFLKKESVVVDEKFNNATAEKSVVSACLASATELKKSVADCSSTMNEDQSSEEKDDLLEQIEEVCNDNVKSSEDISKTSEKEFFKKIEEMEKNDKKVNETASKMDTNIAMELKAKNIIECEASAVDDVVVGDKILDVKEDIATAKNEPIATSSVDIKVLTPISIDTKLEASLEKPSNEVGDDEDALVSISNTPKIENKLSISEKSNEHNKVFVTDLPVESTETAASLIPEEKKDIEKMDIVEENIMEVDEAKAARGMDDNNEHMEVGSVKESVSLDDNVEMLTEENVLDNLAKPKAESAFRDLDKEDVLTAKTSDQKTGKNTCADKISFDTAKSINSNIKPEVMKEATEDNAQKTEAAPIKVVNNKNDDTKVDFVPEESINKPAENKILLDLKPKTKDNIVSSSLVNTPVSSSNVFNSTPIQKQFEISSENVSKISNTAELSHTEKEEEATSTKPLIKSFEDSTTESGTCATSETDQPSSDGTMKKYIDAIKKYNGLPDTTTDEEETSTPGKNKNSNEKFEIKISNLSGSDLKKDSKYEVNVCCEKNDVRYLSIERVDLSSNKNTSETDKPSASESSIQSSSNGSVTSLPAYSLPQTVDTPPSASTSSSINCNSIIISQNKHTILGIEELCNFMINQFTKIKNAVNPDSKKEAAVLLEENTPTHQIKKNKKISPAETPSTSGSKSKRARKRSMQEDDVESTPKAKQVKRDINKETPKGHEAESTESKAGPCVLAKWVDKKFYAGKITGEKPGKKYVVLFEDGASKTLPRESIVFGEGDTLPLQDQHIYALVDEDYESGIVLSIEKSNNKVYYQVKTENTTVKVTASDIYLEVDQAKEIQKIQNVNKVSEGVEEEDSSGTRPSRNKRPPASPSTPEAGYSGAVGKRGGKRQKRLPFNSVPPKRVSEDSDSSDTLESTPPVSPKEKPGLELVEGVQPELQNSANDSELARMIFISDYKKSQPNCDIDELLGPLAKSSTLFRNKHFLLTCTVGLRPHRYQQERTENDENNRFKQFSGVPYVKRYIQKQLEAGGAKIYNYFEDVPKNKYKQCKLIAPRPCITAKYVQCIASDIQAISHDWVVDSCRHNKLADLNKYQLPAGWSILAEKFVQWKIGKNNPIRLSGQPFTKTFVLIAGEHSDFVELWGRVCKAAGAKLRIIKSLDDITPTTSGYMVAESDFSHSIKAKAQYYGIPVVSTVWVVQSLIMGAICPPNSHSKLSQLFEDEEI
ncbi:TP53-binding protein 1-like [Eupeodes corollae]|uniref:TP53-binding protein 1-like n=1 Tax=Eupeodes corollae TaxID=290404 RepID=UPI00248FC081|nr:TP53-binding protein 1-like [Eupeodes corollae]